MKKNGKKYRKLQKNKELKRQTSLTSCIDDEVDGIKTINLAMAQIVIKNPIIKDVENIRKKYIDYLIKYLKLVVGTKENTSHLDWKHIRKYC